MFLKDMDCEGGGVKDGPFIASILIQAIEQDGPQNVVQIITNNAKNYRAVALLVERFKHIFWTPCVVHSLNQMLHKTGTKIEWIKKMYEDAQEIQMLITNHHMTQAIFRQFLKLELFKVVETRFSSNTIVLRRLVKVKEALSRMVINANWSIWRQSNSARAASIREMILDV